MPQFVKILAKVTKRLQALVSVEITRSTAAFWPIVAVCMRRFERPQRVGKRSPTRRELFANLDPGCGPLSMLITTSRSSQHRGLGFEIGIVPPPHAGNNAR